MESFDDSEIVHWGHEPLAGPRWTESADKSDALQTLRARGRVSEGRVSVWSACGLSAAFPRQAAIRWPGRFMESAYVFLEETRKAQLRTFVDYHQLTTSPIGTKSWRSFLGGHVFQHQRIVAQREDVACSAAREIGNPGAEPWILPPR